MQMRRDDVTVQLHNVFFFLRFFFYFGGEIWHALIQKKENFCFSSLFHFSLVKKFELMVLQQVLGCGVNE